MPHRAADWGRPEGCRGASIRLRPDPELGGVMLKVVRSACAAAESFVRNQPNFCPDGTRAPLGPMQCSSMEESVPDKSCLTSVKVCPRRTVWTCSAKYTCAAPLVSCVGGGGSRQ